MNQLDGNAIVYCQGAFQTPNGKTAHGLVRHTRRYQVLSVIDSTCAGADARVLLEGKPSGILVLGSLAEAIEHARAAGRPATHLVIGLAPDGGRLPAEGRAAVLEGIAAGLHVDSGLHDFLSEDATIAAAAHQAGIRLRDVRKPPARKDLHFFDGRIHQVDSLKIAVLGTDSALGKRTTAWLLVDALYQAGLTAELIGTGQTAWMQGARYGLVLDSLINDFVAGEIEFAVWQAWNEQHPDAIVLEGQGSLMNPAYPGGFELLAAGRPDVVLLQHAPARLEYDGFPGNKMHPLSKQIQAIELISEKPVVAITLNHENLDEPARLQAIQTIETETGLPCCDPLVDGMDKIVELLKGRLSARGQA